VRRNDGIVQFEQLAADWRLISEGVDAGAKQATFF
jgi:hypothetical protein